MKKSGFVGISLLILFLGIFFMVGFCFLEISHAKEYRIIADLQIPDEAKAVEVWNYLETIKADVRQEETVAGYNSYAKFVESWDTEYSNAPEYTRMYMDFDIASQVAVVEDAEAKQEQVDTISVKLADYKAKVAEMESVKQSKETEIELKELELISKEK